MNTMLSSSPISPDTKKKKIALPSVLSNIRNAVGRAGGAEEGGKSEVEIRPLLGGSSGVGNNRSADDLVRVGKKTNLRDRTAPPSSLAMSPPPPLLGQSGRQSFPARSNAALASSINVWSERIGSQWRKRSRRDSNERRRRGVTINTQPILLLLGLFFIGLPILLVFYLLARSSVFGDEGVDDVAKHEVPAHETSSNIGVEIGVSSIIVEENIVDENKVDIAESPSAQVLNDLKELTSESEDSLLALDSNNDAEGTNNLANEATSNKFYANGEAGNEATIKEAKPKEPSNEVKVIGENEYNESNLRGSRGERIFVPAEDQKEDSSIEGDIQFSVSESDEILAGASVLDKQVANSEAEEKPVTNS